MRPRCVFSESLAEGARQRGVQPRLSGSGVRDGHSTALLLVFLLLCMAVSVAACAALLALQ